MSSTVNASETSERGIIVKLKLRNGVECESIRRLLVRVSDASSSYSRLKKNSLLLVAGSEDDESDDEWVVALERQYRVWLHYTDDSGDRVLISSDADLCNALSQYAVDGTLVITVLAATRRRNQSENQNMEGSFIELPNIIVKLRVEDDRREPTTRFITSAMLSDEPYKDLMREAMRCVGTGTVEGSAQNGRESGADNHEPVVLHYTDNDGDVVRIYSNEELVFAMRRFLCAGSIKIVATVEQIHSFSGPPMPDAEEAGTAIPPQLSENSPSSFITFASLDELTRAVDEYMDNNSPDSIVARTYGYPIGKWDVSQVTSFRDLFRAGRNPKAAEFNEHLTFWDVSKGKDFYCMFYGASNFNGDLSHWNMSSATTIDGMFYHAKNFNSDLSNWDVSKVKNMAGMFLSAESFRSDLSKWDVSNVSDMSCMFYQAKSFESEIGDWKVSNVTRVSNMFGGLKDRFQSQVSSWDLSKASDKGRIFG